MHELLKCCMCGPEVYVSSVLRWQRLGVPGTGACGCWELDPILRRPVSALDHSHLSNTEGGLFNLHRSQKWLVCAARPVPICQHQLGSCSVSLQGLR